jgi:hypothetical protein
VDSWALASIHFPHARQAETSTASLSLAAKLLEGLNMTF